jgi:hypothetical protein
MTVEAIEDEIKGEIAPNLSEQICQIIVTELDESHYGGKWFDPSSMPEEHWVNMARYSPSLKKENSLSTNVFRLEGLGGVLEAHTIPFGDINEWQTATLSIAVTVVQFYSTSGPNGLTGAYGVDNIRFQVPDPPPQVTPEPGTQVLIAGSLFVILFNRRRSAVSEPHL